MPRLMTNRNVMLVLEGRTGFEERVELNVTRAKPAHWLLQIFLCVCVCRGGGCLFEVTHRMETGIRAGMRAKNKKKEKENNHRLKKILQSPCPEKNKSKRGYTNSMMCDDVILIPLKWVSLMLEFRCNLAIIKMNVKV